MLLLILVFYGIVIGNLDSLIVFGGQAIEPELRSLEDFYVLSIEEWNWKRIFLLRGPSARQFCSLIARGGKSFAR